MNKLFDVIVIGAGATGKRIVKALRAAGIENQNILCISPTGVATLDCMTTDCRAQYVQYIRGIIGVTPDYQTSPEFFAKRLIIACPDYSFLPGNFYGLSQNMKVVSTEAGQLPLVKPLVYVANKKIANYSKEIEVALISSILEGLK